MDGQGFSLFQGGESIALNNEQRAEEEDAIEDIKRRNEEVCTLFQWNIVCGLKTSY